jgi:DNA polymerase-1
VTGGASRLAARFLANESSIQVARSREIPPEKPLVARVPPHEYSCLAPLSSNMKLYLVDGYSLLYRAFFSSPPLTTREGQPTGALYGFTRMLLRLLDEGAPDYALVALDASGPTFRHDSFADYKANRQAAPDDLKTQSRLARELLDGLSVPRYEHSGFEGDDILGTLARTGAEKGLDVTVVTGRRRRAATG